MKKRGAFKIEFAANLPLIKSKIKEGNIVLSMLHDELAKDSKITMSYAMFNYYCNVYGLLDDYKPKKKTLASTKEANVIPQVQVQLAQETSTKQSEPVQLKPKRTSKDFYKDYHSHITDEMKRKLNDD